MSSIIGGPIVRRQGKGMNSLFVCTVFLSLVFSLSVSAQVKTGLNVLLNERMELIEGKRVGIIGNRTSVDVEGNPAFKRIAQHATVTALFGPEHGFEGNRSDAVRIKNSLLGSIPIYSLYGDYLMPTPKMLENVDLLIYDIQDVGVKFYTYISNLFLAMCAAKREGIPVLVLDRPNPIGAVRVEGPITNPAHASFVGVIPLPTRYGMTVGELARLFNDETYAGFALNIDLTVVEMKGYRRGMTFEETGVPWVETSPNMPTVETAQIYPGMCLIEGTNLSEGRGTDAPFLTIGAPFIKSDEWLNSIPKELLKGLKVKPIDFTPRRIPGKVNKPKFQDKPCHGLRFHVQNRDALRSIDLTVALLCSAKKLYGDEFKVRRGIDRLWGDETLRAMLEDGKDYHEILSATKEGVKRFNSVRKKYLIYP